MTAKSSFTPDKKLSGLLAGLILGLGVWLFPIAGLSTDGRKCLAISLVAVVWWASGCMHPGYTSLALLLGFALLLNPEIAPLPLIFKVWSTPTIYMVIGGFLIAAAVNDSGLGERLALGLVNKFVRSYTGLILSCYAMGFLLSFLIPHPWPRSFLLMAIMQNVMRGAGLEAKWAQNIGLAVFAGSVPTAMILLTGDSTLNPAVMGFAGQNISWPEWALYMSVPGILASALTCGLQLLLFGTPKDFSLDSGTICRQLDQLGPANSKEKKVVAVIAAATVLWATDSLHGVPAGWIAVGAAVLLASPVIGALDAKSWQNVNPGTLLFLCAALSIGTVGAATGMNNWIAELLMPSAVPANPFAFALIAAGICVMIHAALGSSLAVLGIASPAIISFGNAAGIPPIASAFIAYTAVALHWLLPFHHMNLLVGLGENGGGYDDKMALKMGVFQTFVVFAVVIFEVFWWNLCGLL